jgi:hypothetical protein
MSEAAELLLLAQQDSPIRQTAHNARDIAAPIDSVSVLLDLTSLSYPNGSYFGFGVPCCPFSPTVTGSQSLPHVVYILRDI